MVASSSSSSAEDFYSSTNTAKNYNRRFFIGGGPTITSTAAPLPELPCNSNSSGGGCSGSSATKKKTLRLFTDTDGGLLGGVVWPAAETLCQFLLCHKDDYFPAAAAVLEEDNGNHCDGGSSTSSSSTTTTSISRPPSVVELGSGTGAVGLFAAGLGARVILTDCCPPPESALYTTDGTQTLPDEGSDGLLRLLQANVEANEDIFEDGPCPCPPKVMELDWAKPSDRERVLLEVKSTSSEDDEEGFDLVLASDVTHFSAMHQPLAATIARLLKRSSGKCLLSHHERLLNSRGQDRQLQAFEAVARVEGLRVAIEMDTQDNLTMHNIKQTLTTRPNPRTMLVLRHGNQEKEQLLY